MKASVPSRRTAEPASRSASCTKALSDGTSSSPSYPRSSRGGLAARRAAFWLPAFLAATRSARSSGSGRRSETRFPKWRASSSSSVSPISSPRPHASDAAPAPSPSETTSSVRKRRESASRTPESASRWARRQGRFPPHVAAKVFCVPIERTRGSALGATHAEMACAEAAADEGSCFGAAPPLARTRRGWVRRTRPSFCTTLLFEGSLASQSMIPPRTPPPIEPSASLKAGCTRYGRGRCCPAKGSPE
mmetsp:Transcript_4821/g.15378  ORF Transcript_4821/g.15378 Transcript_4821/m.15378 type:complete len:248 (+) Transcript_4821:649-1392(+)